MKGKKKIIICAVVAVVVAIIGVVVGVFVTQGNVNSESSTTKATEKSTVSTTTSTVAEAVPGKERKIVVSQSGYLESVMTYNDLGIVYDGLGVRIIDEITEKVIKTFPKEYMPRAFDGETLYIEKRVLDTEVKVNPEQKYDSDGEYLEGWDEYYVGELMKYNLATDKLETIVRTNCGNNDVVYFDDEYLYYSDIPERQIGYYEDYGNYGENSILVKYDLKGKTSTIACEWNRADDVEVLITETDAYVIVDSSTAKVFDIKNGKLYTFEEDAQFNCVKDNKIIYSVLDFESGKLVNENFYEYEYPFVIKQCNFDGSEVEIIKKLTTNDTSESFMGDYPDRFVYCGCKNVYSDVTDTTYTVSATNYLFYDTETDETITIPGTSSEYFVFDGKWYAYKELPQNNTKNIEKVNADGTLDSVCEVPTEFCVERDSNNLSANGFYYLDDFDKTGFGEITGQWHFVKFSLLELTA